MTVAGVPALECDPALANDPSALFDLLASSWTPGDPALRVDFRALMPLASATERGTHLIHPYPAKLLRHIPALFVGAEQLSAPGDVVLDPFCGSGTTLLEAQLAGRDAVGVDTNPLACLIAAAKTTRVAPEILKQHAERAIRAAHEFSDEVLVPHRDRLDRWYHPHVIGQLARLRMALADQEPGPVQNFLQVCLSSTARAVSLADPRVSVPVVHRAERYQAGHRLHAQAVARLESLRNVDVLDAFAQVVAANVERVRALPTDMPRAQVIRGDVRRLDAGLRDRNDPIPSVDLIVTSPPYLGAQKYIRASTLGLYWLDMVPNGELQALARESIGREHFRQAEYSGHQSSGLETADELIEVVRTVNPQRAHLASVYISEMRDAIAAMWRVLRPGGRLVLVVGGNTLCGKAFPTPSYLAELAVQQGFEVRLSLLDRIRSRGLMTRRNSSSGVITEEFVLLFEKQPG